MADIMGHEHAHGGGDHHDARRRHRAAAASKRGAHPGKNEFGGYFWGATDWQFFGWLPSYLSACVIFTGLRLPPKVAPMQVRKGFRV